MAADTLPSSGSAHRLNELQAIRSQHRLLQLNLPNTSLVALSRMDLSNRIPLHLNILSQPAWRDELKLGTTGLPNLEIHLSAHTPRPHRGR